MDVILFIGHHKIGSTSLQHFLSRNWKPLVDAGILYPSVETQGFSHNLALALGRTGPETNPPFNVREAHNALAFKMLAETSEHRRVPPFHAHLPASRQMFLAIERQVQALAPHAVVLCSEVMSNFECEPGLIERLAEFFSGCRITLMATLRRPDSYLVSWHGQRLKFGHKLRPLPAGGMDDYLETIHFDYRKMLEPWIDIFNDERLVLREYGSVLAAGGSVPDFMEQSGLSFPSDLHQFPNANPSIPPALLEIARKGNHHLPGPEAQRLRAYLIGVKDRIALPSSSQVEMYGADNRARLFERFAPIHDWLGTITGAPPFFPDIEKMLEPAPIAETEALAAALPVLRADAAAHMAPGPAREFLMHFQLDTPIS